jgi:hypothetical protein
MGHCGELGYALWVIAANLVVRYGPLCGIKPYIHVVKLCNDIYTMGLSTGFGSMLQAVAQDLVMCYGPE